jgi:hypothetical protein
MDNSSCFLFISVHNHSERNYKATCFPLYQLAARARDAEVDAAKGKDEDAAVNADIHLDIDIDIAMHLTPTTTLSPIK